MFVGLFRAGSSMVGNRDLAGIVEAIPIHEQVVSEENVVVFFG